MESLAHCVPTGVFQIKLKTDSLVMKHILEGSWDVPWHIIKIEEDIKQFTKLHQVNLKQSTYI